MIKITNLDKFYNKNKDNQIHVINNTTLEIPSAGLISFLGTSGSGKTTLLNVIGGLDKADKGSISYDDITFNKYSMDKMDSFRGKNIGYVFQNYNLLLDKSIYDNLAIALEIIGVTDKEEVDKRIEYTLKKVGLYKFRKKLANNLSGGQQQRVSIARALIKNSKIIIADEPTGNLDSTNSIEIMNILKKISKTTLVLLVTHDNNLAEFYSDEIINIKDGQIVLQRKTKSNASLSNDDQKNIYALDLDKKEINSENLDASIYFDNVSEKKLQIDVYEKNGTFYISSAYNIKLLSESDIQVINKHHEEIKKEDTNSEEFDFDTSWYQDKKKNNFLKNLWIDFKKDVVEFFMARKRTKLLHISLMLIGVVIGIANVSYCQSSAIDYSTLPVEQDIYCLTQTEDYFDTTNNPIFLQAYKDGLIDNLYERTNYTDLTINIKQSYYTGTKAQVSIGEGDISLLKNYSYLCGKAPENYNEVVIGKKVADLLLSKLNDKNISYDYLIGQKSTINWDTFTITGVVDKNSNFVYYIKNQVSRHMDGQYLTTNAKYYDYGEQIEYAGYQKYTIMYGKDVDMTSSELQCVLNGNQYDSEYRKAVLNSTYTIYISDIEQKDATIVGFYDGDASNSIIVNDKTIIPTYSNNFMFYSLESNPYYIVEGEEPKEPNDILVSAYTKYKLGDTIKDYKIVGKYGRYDGYSSYGAVLGSISTIVADTLSKESYMSLSYSYAFSTSKKDELVAYFEEHNLAIEPIYQSRYQSEMENAYSANASQLITVLVMLAIAVIYIYFTMRSKMLHDIYSIGVYRSIGKKRISIVKTYLIDIFVNTLFTTLIGYLIVNIGTGIVYNMFNDIGLFFPNLFTCPTTYLGIVALLVANGIFGTLPIVTLLNKTPSEILSKYDI